MSPLAPSVVPPAAGTEAARRSEKQLGLTFLVVQPAEASQTHRLAEQLGRLAALPVVQASDAMPIEPDRVYVVEPSGDFAIRDRMFHFRRDREQELREERQRQRLEAQIRQTQKLESLGLLAGGIAHDFNNLMMGVLANASLMLRHLPEDSHLHPYVENVQRASQRAAELSTQMLAYAGQGRLEIEPLDLSELVHQVKPLLTSSISRKARLIYDFPDPLPRVEADAGQLRQVVINLVVNASEALDAKEGEIRLRLSTVVADEGLRRQLEEHGVWCSPEPLREGDHVLLEVSDTGCGMDEETVSRAFDPFFSTKFAGRGLGLSAVLGIVHGHRGTIQVESVPGRGTTFRVLLPALAEPLPVVEDLLPTVDEAWQGRGTVLLVDDEEIILDSVQRMLEELGFAVLTARDGRDAVETFRQREAEIDCVVLDLTMPNMDGREALEHLLAIRTDVKVLLCSGYTLPQLDHPQVGSTVRFLPKPYTVVQLAENLRQFLG